MKRSGRKSAPPEIGWQPRRRREAALKDVNERLAKAPQDIEGRFDRARLLTELGQAAEAKQAYLDLLALAPTHFGALNNLGALLHATGFRTGARTCYAEAVARHPHNPSGHVNFANALFADNQGASARLQYQTALSLAPEQPEAHQGLANLLHDQGDFAAADRHRRRGFQDRAVTTLAYRGRNKPISVLLLVSAAGGNIPIRPYLDDRTFQVTVIVAEFFDPADPLPPHQLVVNSIGDADLCRAALDVAADLVARSDAPVINPPRAVMATSRIANALRLRTVPGVVTPVMASLRREVLAAPDAFDVLAAHGIAAPFLLRTPGYHNGRNFFRVDDTAGLTAALAALPGDEITAIQFLDARRADGTIAKFRVMIIDGRIFPLHAAISHHWKIHYASAEMADHPDHQAEDSAFLDNMPAVLGPTAIKALAHVRDSLGLDYAGVDFSLNAAGDVLLFEANATMVVPGAEPHDHAAYRRAPVERIAEAIRRMLIERATR